MTVVSFALFLLFVFFQRSLCDFIATVPEVWQRKVMWLTIGKLPLLSQVESPASLPPQQFLLCQKRGQKYGRGYTRHFSSW